MNALCGLFLRRGGSKSRREFHVKVIFLKQSCIRQNSIHNNFLGFKGVVLEILNINVLSILCT